MSNDCNHLETAQRMGVVSWCSWCGAVRIVAEESGGAWMRPIAERVPVELDGPAILGRARAWLAEDVRSMPPGPEDVAELIESELRPLAALLERQGRLLRRAIGVVSDHARIEGETRAVLDEYAGARGDAMTAAAELAAARLLGRSDWGRPCGALGPVMQDDLGGAADGIRRGVRSFACTKVRGHSGEHAATSSLGIELHRWPRE